MESLTSTRPRAPVFYGWWIVAAGFLSQAVAIGLMAYSAGNFVKPVVAELGGTRFTAMVGVVTMNAVMALASPFLGYALDRSSVRRLMAAGGLVFAGGLFALASAPSAAWALPALLVIGVGGGAIGSLSASALVARWFNRRRGLALGFSAIGTSFGGVAMSPLTATLIEAFGWRETLTIVATGVAVLLVPLLYLVVRDHPSDRGTHPDGALEAPAESANEVASLVLGDLLRDLRFWGIVAPIALTFGSFTGIMTNLVPLATDRGESLARASLLMSALAGCGVVGKIAFGSIADRVHPNRALATAIALALTGTVALLAADTYAVLLAASAILGLSTGGMLPVWGALIARAFGPLRFARVMGLMQPVMMPLSLASAPFAGFVRDSTGTYTVALQVFAAAFALAVTLALVVRTEPRDG